MDNIKLYRRRYIPDETVFLKDDEIIYADNDRIVTKWKALKPRSDFAGGMSVCYLKEGYKVSRMTDISGKAVFYYCDIVETVYDDCRQDHKMPYDLFGLTGCFHSFLFSVINGNRKKKVTE